jgi:hypothetical protein
MPPAINRHRGASSPPHPHNTQTPCGLLASLRSRAARHPISSNLQAGEQQQPLWRANHTTYCMNIGLNIDGCPAHHGPRPARTAATRFSNPDDNSPARRDISACTHTSAWVSVPACVFVAHSRSPLPTMLRSSKLLRGVFNHAASSPRIFTFAHVKTGISPRPIRSAPEDDSASGCQSPRPSARSRSARTYSVR